MTAEPPNRRAAVTQRSATIVLSGGELQAIVDELPPIGSDRPALDVVRLGAFELSRGEFQTLVASVAVQAVPIESIRLKLAHDGSIRATWINPSDPPTASTRLIRPGA